MILMKKQLRFGLLGCGMVGHYHASAIGAVEDCTLVACASKTYSSAEKLAKEFGTEARHSYDDLLSDSSINFITICTPSGNHFEDARKALLAGKNVVVEKPISLRPEQADDLIDLAKEKGLILCTISQTRFSDAVQAIHKAVIEGRFGKMVSAQLMMRYMRGQEYYDQASWRGSFEGEGGGMLMNQGIHGIDVLCYIMGQPVSVMGYTATRLRRIEGEDTAVAAIEFADGSLAVVDATVCSNPSFTKKFIFCGEKGTVVLENDVITTWSLPQQCPVKVGASSAGSSSADPRGISTEYHTREFRNLRDHYVDGRALLVDGIQGKLPLSVICGIYESSDSGKRIAL